MILKTTITTRDLAPHNSFLLFPSIFMITISRDDHNDPGHKIVLSISSSPESLGFSHGFPGQPGYADTDGSKLPQENPVPATSWMMSSSKMSKIQRHAAAQVAWTLFQVLSPQWVL